MMTVALRGRVSSWRPGRYAANAYISVVDTRPILLRGTSHKTQTIQHAGNKKTTETSKQAKNNKNIKNEHSKRVMEMLNKRLALPCGNGTSCHNTAVVLELRQNRQQIQADGMSEFATEKPCWMCVSWKEGIWAFEKDEEAGGAVA